MDIYEEILKIIFDVTKTNNPYSVVDDFINQYGEKFSEKYKMPINEWVFRMAIKQKELNYVKLHMNEFILNDKDGYSSFINETEDKETQQLLMDYGAKKMLKNYYGCKFAMESSAKKIIAFNRNFQIQIFKEYMENFNLTEEKVIDFVNRYNETYNEEYNQIEGKNGYQTKLMNDIDSLGVTVIKNEIVYKNKVGDDVYGLCEILECILGYELEYEGKKDTNKTDGIFLIK